MRIGEVALRTGVATRMLRYYEEQGLLSPTRRVNGYRDYTDADVRQVATIRDLSGSGVPTRFIKIVLDKESGALGWTSTCDDIVAGMVAEQIADLDGKIACLTASRTALAQFLRDAGTLALAPRDRQPLAASGRRATSAGHGEPGSLSVARPRRNG